MSFTSLACKTVECGVVEVELMLMKAKSAMQGRSEAQSYMRDPNIRVLRWELLMLPKKTSGAKSVEEVEVVLKRRGEG
jgi:hypothetical protein